MKKLLNAILFAALSSTAYAGLIGATVNVSANFPDPATVYADGGNQVVGAGVEYPAGIFAAYNSSWQVDITDTQMIVSNTTAGFPLGRQILTGLCSRSFQDLACYRRP